MWIRTDWMEALNLSAPTTWEEFTHFIQTLKDSGLCTNNSSGFSFLGVASESLRRGLSAEQFDKYQFAGFLTA